MVLRAFYRLAARGEAGLGCDEDGLALGVASLVRMRPDSGGARRCEVRPPDEIGQILRAAYGPRADGAVKRVHRGLRRAAQWIEAGDIGRAGVEAVKFGFPNLTPDAMAKLAAIADLQNH